MFISRKTYDSLILIHTVWMQWNWNKLDRDWSLAGVRVDGTAEQLAELRVRLDRISDDTIDDLRGKGTCWDLAKGGVR